MKVRTGIIIGAAVIVGVGGLGYAAYYTMRGQASPVDVAPVANVSLDDEWVSYDDSMTGSVTSKVSQTVSLDSEHEVDEVFVKEGQEVKEGDPLFSYDMTLEEIELEAQEIELQSLQLQLSKYEKDLEKYRNTPATASLEAVDYDDLSESAQEAPAEEAYVEPAEPEVIEAPAQEEEVVQEEPAQPAEPDEDSSQIDAVENTGSSTSTNTVSDTDSNASDDAAADEEEETEQPSTAEDEDAIYRNAVLQYESLMMSIEMFLDENGNLSYDSSVVSALYNARDFFENNLANSVQQEPYTDENGEMYVNTTYEISGNVVHALSEDELSELAGYANRMYSYIAIYEFTPEMMSAEPEAVTGSETQPEPETEEDESQTDESLMQITPFSVTVTVQDDLGENGVQDVITKEVDAEEPFKTTATDRTKEGYKFEFWEVDLSYVDLGDPFSEDLKITVPAENVTLTAVYTPIVSGDNTDSEAILSTFIDWVDYIHTLPSYQAPDKEKLINAIEFYIGNLSSISEGEISDSIDELLAMIELSDTVKDYLNSKDAAETLKKLGAEDGDQAVEILQNMYSRICIEYCIYQLANLYDAGIEDEDQEAFLTELEAVYKAYASYTGTDPINSVLENLLLKMYDESFVETEPDSETETETEEASDSNRNGSVYDSDWGGYDWEGGEGDEEYTAEELAEMIAELEQQIKETELSIKECELSLNQAQRAVDERVVTSKLNGTVVSIGESDEESEDDYFIKVTDMEGLYAKGVISELELDTVTLGDVVSGITDDGQSFTAVIKDIADYPDPNGLDYTYGSGNTNATYYSFSALIDEPEGIEEGSAELTLSTALAEDRDSIWLDTYMVRTDAAGNNYVYVEGDKGELEMRYVSTGSVDSDWAIEITGGLSRSDNIAFPYGDDVHEGAPTKEVSNLDSIYE